MVSATHPLVKRHSYRLFMSDLGQKRGLRCRLDILYPDQVLAPCRGILVYHATEASFQLLIEAFGLAISFWVVSRR